MGVIYELSKLSKERDREKLLHELRDNSAMRKDPVTKPKETGSKISIK